jgi:SIR2-like domain
MREQGQGFHPLDVSMIDPLVSLVHAVYSNKGIYAVLLGSGISRAAGIPTGWEITLELVRRIAQAEGVSEEIVDPGAWFQKTKGREAEYSALLDMLAVTPEERRAILHRFIEPTAEEAESGIKVPTAAHRALARLTATGYIRAILTTNFDRLTETALREAGVEPIVISSADDAAGAMPLTHAGCVVVKLHGDYLDSRIRNTPSELSAYDPRMDQYLDRVLDEFGLIVVGWSAEWDDALRAAIARCPTRRFSTWWAELGGRLRDRARDLADARRAQIIAIKSADDFLTAVEQKVLSLADLDRSHPLSANIAVAELKRYLLDPQQQIRLHDLVFETVRNAVARTDVLTTQGQWSEAEFRNRVERYEAASDILRPLAAIGARWCREQDEGIWCDVVHRTWEAHRSAAGLVAWIELQTYLPMLVFYSVGLGATAGGRFKLLKHLFEMRTPFGERSAVERLLPYSAFSELSDPRPWSIFRNSVTAISDHILDLLKQDAPDLAGGAADFDDLMDRFEILAALSFAHSREPANLPSEGIWFPPGRFVWRLRHHNSQAIKDWFGRADIERDEWPPIVGGLFSGSFARFSALRAALLHFVNQTRW